MSTKLVKDTNARGATSLEEYMRWKSFDFGSRLIHLMKNLNIRCEITQSQFHDWCYRSSKPFSETKK